MNSINYSSWKCKDEKALEIKKLKQKQKKVNKKKSFLFHQESIGVKAI